MTKKERSKACKRYYREHSSVIKARAKRRRELIAAINKQWVLEYLLAHPCSNCGETDPVCLEFDHLSNKTETISRLIKWASPERLQEEIDKCQVLCSNCHAKKTAEQFGYFKDIWDECRLAAE